MALLDRPALLKDVKFWLPPSNQLTDSELVCNIIELYINSVGDDLANHAEILCKSLKLAAQKNSTMSATNNGGLKREKIGTEEYEYYEGGVSATASVWVDFIESLADICPAFGYTGLTVNDGVSTRGGIKINSGTTYNPVCQSTTDIF